MKTPLPKISAPALRALDSIKVYTLEDLSVRTEEEILGLHGFGKNGMKMLSEAMKAAGVEFAKGS